MKTWLKGGLWGLGIGILFYFMVMVGIPNIFIGNIIQKVLFFILSPVCLLLENTSFVGGDAYAGICVTIFGLPFNIIFYGILGVIVGLIIELKSKKQITGKKKR